MLTTISKGGSFQFRRLFQIHKFFHIWFCQMMVLLLMVLGLHFHCFLGRIWCVFSHTHNQSMSNSIVSEFEIRSNHFCCFLCMYFLVWLLHTFGHIGRRIISTSKMWRKTLTILSKKYMSLMNLFTQLWRIYRTLFCYGTHSKFSE